MSPGVPLGPAQQRLWLADLLQPGVSAYNVPYMWRLEGQLNADALEQALAHIVERHQPLRARFCWSGQQPTWSCQPQGPGLTRIDLQQHGDPERQLQALCARWAEQPFSLEHDLPCRFCLIRLGPTHHLLLCVFHHAIFDGWSQRVLCQELSLLYSGHSLPPLEVTYADYCRWIHSEPRSWHEPDLGYWKGQLAPLPRAEVAPDRPRRSGPGHHRAALCPITIPAPLLTALQALGQRHGATPYMVLLASLGELLSRHCGLEQVVIGSPVAGRDEAETHPLIGCFINLVPMIVSRRSGPNFDQLVQRVREQVLQSLKHAHVPFEHIVRSLALPPQPDRHPLFSSMLFYQNTVSPNLELAGLRTSPIQLHNGQAKVDLCWHLVPRHGGLEGALEYNRDLYRPSTARRLVQRWVALLQAVVEPRQAALPVRQLARLSPAEQRWLSRRNHTHHSHLPHTALELFLAQVQAHPQRLALVHDNQLLSYQQLHQLALSIAEQLHQGGVRCGCLVAIQLPRTPALVAAILACWKAEAAFLPLLPDLPPGRFQQYLQQARPSHLLDARGLHELPDAQPVDHSAAYLLFTSGSSGLPKGVLVGQAALSNLLQSMARRPGFGPHDAMLAITPLSFDIALLELLLPLICGGQLYLSQADPPPWQLLEQVTVVQATPSVWSLLCHRPWKFPRLRAWCGGEALPAPLASQLLQRTGQLWNLYGPTETTIWSCCGPVSQGPISLGQPIDNTRVYLLDSDLQPVPVGVPGDLWLAGQGLALGYLGQPQLTAHSFRPHPQQPSERIYLTGDRARWWPDGRLEFLGRRDDQVKLRGWRVELCEVEDALGQLPSVRQAAVRLHGDRLMACLVGEPRPATELRQTLATHLPEALIPDHFQWLPALPLSPNGKVDRQRLPLPNAPQPSPQAPPHSALQEQLLELWGEVLGTAQLAIHDNFFELGGHSLLAAQLVSRLRALLGLELPLRTLFDHPSVAALAQHLGGLRGQSQALPLEPGSAVDPPLLSSAQRRLWFLERLEGNLLAYTMISRWRLRGPLDLARLERAFQQIVSRHHGLRTAIVARQGLPTARLLPVPPTLLAVRDLSSHPQAEQQAEELARSEAEKPFDLGCDVLLRPLLLRLDPQHHILLIRQHHIASDGWSQRVLLRELDLAYQGQPLAPLPYQVSHFARWQQQRLQGPWLQRLEAYWKQQLQGLPLLQLPLDAPRPARSSHRGAQLRFQLPPDRLTPLKNLALSHGVTLQMVLLAAFQLLLGRYSQQHDLAVAVPSAGRRQVEFEPLIGLFANTLVLRANLEGQPSFAELLGRTRQASLLAYDHEELPFEKVVEAVAPERHLNHNPLAQVLFQLQHANQGPPSLGPLQLEPMPSPSQRTRFDLEMHLVACPQGLQGTCIYDCELFQAATIERLLGYFQHLLTEIGDDPQRCIHDYRLGPPQALLPPPQTPPLPTLDRLLLQQWQSTPQALALVQGQHSYRCAWLQQQVLRLAASLQQRGVGPESLVALHLPPSVESIVALLAVLCAGGAYLPLDPQSPMRSQSMLQQARPQLLIQGPGPQLSLPDACQPFDLNLPLAEASAYQPPLLNAQSLAYVMFTSGSSGQPKGVAATHGATSNRLLWMQQAFPFQPDDRCCQRTALTFVDSVAEILGPLCAGVPLVLLAPPHNAQPKALLQALHRHRITRLVLVPSLLRALLAHNPPSPHLKLVVCSGETLDAPLARQFYSCYPGAQLLNLYGCTEVAADVSYHLVEPEGHRRPPIGRPIANVELRVLDPQGRPLPPDLPGTLHVLGAALARGYWNQPDLTARAFPLASDGARMYCTGDLARWRPDGLLEYLGRRDGQHKLRGVRLEEAEIESAIALHPAVGEAAVAVVDQQLVAHWTAVPGASLSSAELRAWLAERLATAWVPSQLFQVPQLPRTPTGKLDRQAVRPLPSAQPASQPAPCTCSLVEQRLLALWRQVLGNPRLGLHDDFFALGGHSLLALELLYRIEQEFSCQLELASLFTSPTVQLQAALLRNPASGASGCLVPLPAHGPQPPLYLVHPLGGAVLVYEPLARQFHGQRPVYGLQAQGLFASPQDRLQDMASSYLGAILQRGHSGPFLFGGLSLGGLIAYEMARQLAEQQGQLATVLLLDSYGPGYRSIAPSWGQRLAFHLEGLARVGPRPWLAYILGQLRRRFQPPTSTPDNLQQARILTRQAALSYGGGPYSGPVHLLRARHQSATSPDYGWSRHAPHLQVHPIPGLHGEVLLQAPYCLQPISQRLQAILAANP